MGRSPCCDKAKVRRGPWSSEEDATLISYIQTNGTGGNWISLPSRAGLKRCGKSCRLRWLNYLRPNIKHGGFTEEEDNIICTLYRSIGSRWSIIASKLPGRTDNDIKNYWNSKLKKRFLVGQFGSFRSIKSTVANLAEVSEPNPANLNPGTLPSLVDVPTYQTHHSLAGLQCLKLEQTHFDVPEIGPGECSSFYSTLPSSKEVGSGFCNSSNAMMERNHFTSMAVVNGSTIHEDEVLNFVFDSSYNELMNGFFGYVQENLTE